MGPVASSNEERKGGGEKATASGCSGQPIRDSTQDREEDGTLLPSHKVISYIWRVTGRLLTSYLRQ